MKRMIHPRHSKLSRSRLASCIYPANPSRPVRFALQVLTASGASRRSNRSPVSPTTIRARSLPSITTTRHRIAPPTLSIELRIAPRSLAEIVRADVHPVRVGRRERVGREAQDQLLVQQRSGSAGRGSVVKKLSVRGGIPGQVRADVPRVLRRMWRE